MTVQNHPHHPVCLQRTASRKTDALTPLLAGGLAIALIPLAGRAESGLIGNRVWLARLLGTFMDLVNIVGGRALRLLGHAPAASNAEAPTDGATTT